MCLGRLWSNWFYELSFLIKNESEIQQLSCISHAKPFLWYIFHRCIPVGISTVCPISGMSLQGHIWRAYRPNAPCRKIGCVPRFCGTSLGAKRCIWCKMHLFHDSWESENIQKFERSGRHLLICPPSVVHRPMEAFHVDIAIAFHVVVRILTYFSRSTRSTRSSISYVAIHAIIIFCRSRVSTRTMHNDIFRVLGSIPGPGHLFQACSIRGLCDLPPQLENQVGLR